MSEKGEKKHTIDDLDFDSLSGGVEQKERSEPLAVAPSPITATLQNIHDMEEEFIYLDRDEGKGKLIKLKDATGVEFLEWVEYIYPPFKTQRIDPARFDGPDHFYSKKQIINSIGKFYEEAYLRKGINLNKVKQ
jgi:hypothetical protein